MTSEGALDLAAGRGWMRVSLASIADVEEFDRPVRLRWDREELVAQVGDGQRRAPRAEARESGGLIGRLPDEPAGLVGLLASARETRALGTEVVDGRETTGYRLPLALRAAGEAGVPVELSGAFAAGTGARSFALEVWLDDELVPRRLGYLVELDEVRSGGRSVLPRRSIRAMYELSGFGDEVGAGRLGE